MNLASISVITRQHTDSTQTRPISTSVSLSFKLVYDYIWILFHQPSFPTVRQVSRIRTRWGFGAFPTCPSHSLTNSIKALLWHAHLTYLKKVAHTRLPSVGFRSWSRFLAVSLQVTRVINLPLGCHYFPPGLQLPPQPLRGLLPILLLSE